MGEGDGMDYKKKVFKLISTMAILFLGISILVMGYNYYSYMRELATSLISCVGILDMISTIFIIFIYTIGVGSLILVWIVAVLFILDLIKGYMGIDN